MNKKAQLDFPLISIVIVIFGLLLIAPIMLKIFISIKAPMSSSLGNLTNQGGAIAQANFNHVIDIGITWWDKVIVSAFFLSILLLVISSIMIDTHPVWVILYIFIAFMLILFAPDIIGSLDAIYNSSTFATEVTYLSFMNSLRTHFGEFLVGLIVLTGIIIYGKIALFRSGNTGSVRR